MEIEPPPDDFLKLCALTRSLCGFDRQMPRNKVEVLPPSAAELARRVQGTQEFRSLADSLFRKLSDEDYTGKAALAEVLKRCSFYHSSLKGWDAKDSGFVSSRLLNRGKQIFAPFCYSAAAASRSKISRFVILALEGSPSLI
jgi:hypothetical protein